MMWTNNIVCKDNKDMYCEIAACNIALNTEFQQASDKTKMSSVDTIMKEF